LYYILHVNLKIEKQNQLKPIEAYDQCFQHFIIRGVIRVTSIGTVINIILW